MEWLDEEQWQRGLLGSHLQVPRWFPKILIKFIFNIGKEEGVEKMSPLIFHVAQMLDNSYKLTLKIVLCKILCKNIQI
jgi:hypothetical protein